MKTAFIIVLYNTGRDEISRLEEEVRNIGLNDYKIYWIDNSKNGKGYAEGVNEGIRQSRADKAELLVIANPDISFEGITSVAIDDAGKHFDIWGFAMKQDGKVFYGGEIDKWRMSGGLVERKPDKQFKSVDFVTGSLMMMKSKVIDQIGDFDETYFMYYEDVDYCQRANRQGLRVGIDSHSSYVHFESSKNSSQKDYLLAKNRLLFLIRYGNIGQKIREFVRIPRTLIEERSLLFSLLFRSVFVRNFFSLNAGAFIEKILHFLLFFLMVRYIPIKDYGIYTLVWAHVTLLSPLVDFGTTSYGMVYLPREKKEKAHSLFTLRLVLSFTIFLITVFLAFLFHYTVPVIFYIFLVSFVIFNNMTSGMYLIISSIREELVKNSLISVLTEAVMIFAMILVLVITKNVGAVLATASFFYIFYSFFYAILIKGLLTKLKLVINPKEWFSIVKKSYVFVLVSFFAGIYFKIDVLVLNYLKGSTAVGIYSSGYKFFEAMILFASSYNTLSASIFSKTAFANKKQLLPKVLKHALFLSIIGFSVVAGTQIFGRVFLPFILKGNYVEAIEVVRIVIWALPFILFNSIFLNLLYASDLSSLAVFLFLGMSTVNLMLNFLFVPRFSYIASAYITVFSEMINLLLLLIIVFVIHRKKIFHE